MKNTFWTISGRLILLLYFYLFYILFRQHGIFCKVLKDISSDEIFFKKLTSKDKSDGEVICEKPEQLDDMVKSIKTFKYLDKILLSCKICNFLTEGRDKIERHVRIFHIEPRRRMSERDIVINYVT